MYLQELIKLLIIKLIGKLQIQLLIAYRNFV